MDHATPPAAELFANPAGADFNALVAHVQAVFTTATHEGSRLFRTDPADLFDVYLAALPAADRQEHHCAACRRFLTRYGGLVTIDDAGRPRSSLWAAAGAPPFYRPVIEALRRRVERGAVRGVFLDSSPVWGVPTRGGWTHLAVTPEPGLVIPGVLQTADQAMAEKQADFATLQRALAEWPPAVLTQSCRVLDSDALFRAEKVAGPARWLLALQEACLRVREPLRTNLVWRAVASAPPGFCHPRATMVGTLLDDLAAGLSFAEVSRRFAAKMHPLQYQRPQAAPTAGNIARAEKLVEQLGIARSLERRFATVDEVPALWRPKTMPTTPPGGPRGGVFGHLQAKGAAPSPSPIDLPPATMTWVKFARTVLPLAEHVAVFVDQGPQNFTALLTAVHADAPPILQWDALDRRNPVSWYVYHGGSPPSQWSLVGGRYQSVTAIVGHPARWGQPEGSMAHQGESVLFLLEGARETRTDQGNALFPETLKSHLHEVRATIEAFSRSAVIAPPPGGVEWACGLMFAAGSASWSVRVRVRVAGAERDYQLDRWD